MKWLPGDGVRGPGGGSGSKGPGLGVEMNGKEITKRNFPRNDLPTTKWKGR